MFSIPTINLDDIDEDFLNADLSCFEEENGQEKESSKHKGDELEVEQSKKARSDIVL